jgi:hypothetical protein
MLSPGAVFLLLLIIGIAAGLLFAGDAREWVSAESI